MENNNRQVINVKDILLSDLRKELDAEMKKPVRKRDTDKIKKLTNDIYELTYGNDITLTESIENSKNKLYEQLRQPTKRNNIKIHRRIVAAAASVIVLLGANTVSLKVSGENIFSSVYHLSKNGITWRSYELPEDNEPFVPDNDPYDIGKRIYEWEQWDNLGVLIPTYLPKGFEEAEFKSDDNGISFKYVNGNSKDFFENEYIAFYIERIPKGGNFKVPCDEYNIREITVDNFDGIMFEEDMQMKAVFDVSDYVSNHSSNYYIKLSTLNVPYTKAEKVLFTMKEYKE